MAEHGWDDIEEVALLRWCRQWLVAAPYPDKRPLRPVSDPTSPRGFKLVDASSTNPKHWMDYETAKEYAAAAGPGYGIGFVLTDNDPFTVIDLDVKNQHNAPDKPHLWSTPAHLKTYEEIFVQFDSFSERSASRQGVHIIVRGNIGAGVKSQGVEVYSRDRFIVCTGDVVRPVKPIADRQQLLERLVAKMRQHQAATANHTNAGLPDDVNIDEIMAEVEPELTDAQVWERALTADNADKFRALCSGAVTWGPNGEYPSQSEADLALLSIFAFYSKSNEQCRRLFRLTELGKRDKAVKNDYYLNKTLQRIRIRQHREAAIAAQSAEHGRQLAAQLAGQGAAPHAPQQRPLGGSSDQGASTAPVASQPAPVLANLPALTTDDENQTFDSSGMELPEVEGDMPWPPGCAGAIAYHIYRSSVRPVKEIAVASALGLLAGMCGKPFQVSGTGLNHYIVLVAPSGVGKEALHLGISGFINHIIRAGVPGASQFIEASDMASGQALARLVASRHCFVNMTAEFGRKLQRMSDNRPDAAMQSLRTMITELFQRSGSESLVGGLNYADKERNVASVAGGVAFSLVGESTPATFYEALTDTMMSDGFLSRFTIFEYTGRRVPQNRERVEEPEKPLLDWMCGLATQSLSLMSRQTAQTIALDGEAQALFDEYNDLCDANINSTDDESLRQLWNRAHLRALRMAGLLAVADNYHNPVITAAHARWALDTVNRGIRLFLTRLESGEIGEPTDQRRNNRMVKLLTEYLTQDIRIGYYQGRRYADAEKLKKNAIIPYYWLVKRTQNYAEFKKHPFGTTRAIKETISNLMDAGVLELVSSLEIKENYGASHGTCYRILKVEL